MDNRTWNILLKIVLSILALTAAFYTFDVTKGVTGSDVGSPVYPSVGSASMTGFFLLIGLLVLAWYVPNRAFPSKSNFAMLVIVPLVVIFYFLVVSLFG